MKRSKIILGLGALLLASAGAFATTSHYRATTGWYQGPNGPAQTTIDITCPEGQLGCVGTSGDAEGLQLYTSADFDNPYGPRP